MPRNKVMKTDNTEEQLVEMGMSRKIAQTLVYKSQRYKKALEIIEKHIEQNTKGVNEKSTD